MPCFLEFVLFQSLIALKPLSFPKEWPRPLKAVLHCSLISGGTTRQSCWCSLKITSRTAGLWTKPMKPKTARQPEHSLPSCDRRVVLPPSLTSTSKFFCCRCSSDCFVSGAFARKGANWPGGKSCRRFPDKTLCRAIDVMRDHAKTILSAACIWKG